MPGSPPKRRLNHERLTFAIGWLAVATGRAGAHPLVALPSRLTTGFYLDLRAGRETEIAKTVAVRSGSAKIVPPACFRT